MNAVATALAASRQGALRSYCWSGRERSGRNVSGRIEAVDRDAARRALARQGVFECRLRPDRRRAVGHDAAALALFTRQLAAIVRAGLPLLQALQALADGSRQPSVALMVRELRTQVATGSRLSEAMARHPAFFPALYRSLLAVGEEAGVLDATLERLASHQERMLALRRQVRTALTYPLAVLGVALAVVAVVLTVVVPTFESVFASMGAELPWATQVVVKASALLVQQGPAIGLTAVGLWWTVCEWARRDPRVLEVRDRLVPRVPIVGALVREGLSAQWARTLATVLAAGVPLVQALAFTAQSSGNRHLQALTMGVQQRVSSGQGLGAALAGLPLLAPIVGQMAAMGEACGSLDELLARAADLMEGEVDARVKAMSQLLEPLLIVTLGLLIGGIVVALYLPIFQMGALG